MGPVDGATFRTAGRRVVLLDKEPGQNCRVLTRFCTPAYCIVGQGGEGVRAISSADRFTPPFSRSRSAECKNRSGRTASSDWLVSACGKLPRRAKGGRRRSVTLMPKAVLSRGRQIRQ